MNWIRIASVDELADDEVKSVNVQGVRVALYRVDGEFFATDDRCTHAEALMSEGYVEDGCIECPLHQARFDIRTGKVQCAPATEDLRTHAIRREADEIYIADPAGA